MHHLVLLWYLDVCALAAVRAGIGRITEFNVGKLIAEIGTSFLHPSRGARSKGTTYVNMKFFRFKKLGLSFLYVHQ
ncbi:hypothetical protein Tco_0642175 [Tanacetum coccineum]